MNDAILIADLDECVTYINDRAAAMFGVPVGQGIGRQLTDILRQQAEAPSVRERRQLLKSDGEWSGSLSWKEPGGPAAMIPSVWTLVRDKNDAPLSILVVCASRSMHETAIAGGSLETIGAMAAGIAHHLNDIFGSLMMTLGGVNGQRKQTEWQRTLKGMKDIVQRGSGFVRQLLSVAAADVGAPVPVSVNHVLQTLDGFARHTFPKTVSISVLCRGSEAAVVPDGPALFRVLLDLMRTVMRSAPAPNDLCVSSDVVEVDRQWAQAVELNADGNVVLLRVYRGQLAATDGNNDEQSMYRPGATYAELECAVGAMGGILRTMQAVPDPSGFVVCLPVRIPGSSSEQRPSTALRGSGEIILVVDDEVAIRESTRMTLLAHGYRVLIASDGAEAVSLYAEHAREIGGILMDIMMPYMTGDAAIRAILQINPDAHIIAVSGFTTPDKISHIVDLDSVTLLQKPYTANQLLAVLRGVLDGQPGVPSLAVGTSKKEKA